MPPTPCHGPCRDEICSLTIRRVQAEHNGPWLCVAEDDRGDEDQQYVFLDVKNAGSRLEVGAHLATEVDRQTNIFTTHISCSLVTCALRKSKLYQWYQYQSCPAWQPFSFGTRT